MKYRKPTIDALLSAIEAEAWAGERFPDQRSRHLAYCHTASCNLDYRLRHARCSEGEGSSTYESETDKAFRKLAHENSAIRLSEAEKETGISVAEQLRLAVRLWNTLPAVAKRGYQNLLGDGQEFLNKVVPDLDELLDWIKTQVYIARNKAACEEELVAIHRTSALILDRVAAYRNRGHGKYDREQLDRSEPRQQENESEIEKILRRLAWE